MSLRKAIERILKSVEELDTDGMDAETLKAGFVQRLQVALDASEGAAPDECCLNKPLPKIGPETLMPFGQSIEPTVIFQNHRRALRQSEVYPKDFPVTPKPDGEETTCMRLCRGGPSDGEYVLIASDMPVGAKMQVDRDVYELSADNFLRHVTIPSDVPDDL